jgi:hypothetical protein
MYPPTAEDVAFEAELRAGTADPLPWGSVLGLLIVAAAFWHGANTPASAAEVVGYGVTNLGYVLAAAGIFKGTFLAFCLRRRAHVFVLAAVCVLVGVALSNVRT